MKCFRAVDPKWADPDSLLNGKGAALGGGRWNELGIPVINTGTRPSVAVAEKGYYAIIQNIDDHSAGNDHLERDRIRSIKLSLATISIVDSLDIVNLTTDGLLLEQLRQAGLGTYSVLDGRKSPYELLPHTWTQKLSSFLQKKGAQGLRACSARSDAGEVLVLFPTNLRSLDARVEEIEDIEIAALDHAGKRLGKKGRPSSNEILFSHRGGSTLVEVLRFKL